MSDMCKKNYSFEQEDEQGVLDAFAVVLRLNRFSKDIKAEHVQEQKVVTQEAEGKSRNV